MKKLIRVTSLIGLLFCTIIFSSEVFAAAVLTIRPSLNMTFVRADSQTVVTYTVTNNSGVAIPGAGMQFNLFPAGGGTTAAPGSATIFANTCSTTPSLANGASCTFSILVNGQNQPSSFTFRPNVCIFNGVMCSCPTLAATDVITIMTIPVVGPVRAYLGISSGMATISRVLPINLATLTTGNLIASANFNFNFINIQGMALSPNGTRAYVLNDALAAGFDFLTVIDTATNQVIATINLTPTAAGVWSSVVISPDGMRAYVANFANNIIDVINLTTNTRIATINTLPGAGPAFLTISPDGASVFVSNLALFSTSVIDTATNTLSRTIPFGRQDITVSPDGRFLYLINPARTAVQVINVATGTLVTTIPVPAVGALIGSAITPNGQTLLVTDIATGSIHFINTLTNTFVGTLTNASFAGLAGLAVTPGGTRAVVATNGGPASCAPVVDIIGRTLITCIPQGGVSSTEGAFVG